MWPGARLQVADKDAVVDLDWCINAAVVTSSTATTSVAKRPLSHWPAVCHTSGIPVNAKPALVRVAEQYTGVFGRLRLDIKHERAEMLKKSQEYGWN